jgi:hypothetical protein
VVDIERIRIAKEVVEYVSRFLKKHGLSWLISGGFACYVYGVDRPITDIDIDILAGKDDKKFKAFLNDLKDDISSQLQHFRNEHYDNYCFEITYKGQVVDFCTSKDLKVFDPKIGRFELFYENSFPKPEVHLFEGLKIPLLPKALIIQNKEMILRDEFDKRDIDGLKKLIK